MRIGQGGDAGFNHGLGLLFSIACLVGLYLAWPYLKGSLAGTWFADLDLLVLVVFVAVALSGCHVLEGRVSSWFAGEDKGSTDH